METSASFEARSAPSSYPTAIGIEGDDMSCDHERLDVYRAAARTRPNTAVRFDSDADTDSDSDPDGSRAKELPNTYQASVVKRTK
jgi:hypothetical protein